MGTQTTIVEKESSRKKIWVRKDLFTSQETSEEVVTPSRPGPASKTGRPPYHGEVNSTNWEQHLISDNEDKEEHNSETEDEEENPECECCGGDRQDRNSFCNACLTAGGCEYCVFENSASINNCDSIPNNVVTEDEGEGEEEDPAAIDCGADPRDKYCGQVS